MFVLLNPESGGARSIERWRSVEPDVRRRIGPYRLEVAAGPLVIRSCVRRALERGETDFVAAGGDGTVNAVVSAIVEHLPAPALRRIRVGAIGLGSSNDFHKPASPESVAGDIPIRLDFGGTVTSDLCRIDYLDSLNRFGHCSWLINASLGTTAEANCRFNRSDGLICWLKTRLPSAAMVYAAIRTIISFRAQTLDLEIGPEKLKVRARNVGIVKKPTFSGSLRYGSEPAGPGRMGVHLIDDVGITRLCLIVARLLRGRFEGPGTRSWIVSRLSVSSDRPFLIERDGEVIRTRAASFRVLPGAIQLCT
ncbi:MAG: hypothetical protein M8860_02035 [marine benthic group bacterium]|jgi:diacylglycerol kinase family enzyme|nr:hypothetical protein [Gemmatimonadota bacterium]MCL7961615.1 hypothetical protein [Candidatus Carthagonibacter metallireducens]MCL7963780.1 hypothetical protein [Gemmatimonadota bacterium]MCL7968462.1 hypothetical protein [Gemmatimonadota bacterium]MCL7981000.1 hypothetical protein [Gemmatimonadota bacterium]